MGLVNKIEDMIENAERFDNYLKSGTPSEKEFAIRCIALGNCFVVIKEKDDYKFYPSKYIGYQNNSEANYWKAYGSAGPIVGEEKYGDAACFTFDGRMSNKAITKILGCCCEKDYEMSEKFIAYCNKYGLKGSDKRKFWLKIIEK